ncbi:MAG TPA: outer membrane protein [Microvirga sp.]|jgi:outer membrane immunogenic protein
MKKILLSSVAFLGLATGALAADLPSRRAPAPMIAAVPVFTWTGFYVGVNAGYGFSTNDDNTVFIPGVGFVSGGDDDGGFLGGGQIGYNFQFGSFVLGVEADLQYADLGGSDGRFYGTTYYGGAGGLDYFGTVRARAGVAFDRALIYATGGFAYGGGGNDSGCFYGTTFVASCGGDDNSGGWTIGAGVEYAITNNLTVKVEGLYVNLDQGGDDGILTTGILNNRDDLEFGVVRAGLNFKF